MRKTRTELPDLPQSFPDQLSFCSLIGTSIATMTGDMEDSNPHQIRKMMFVNHSWRLSPSGCHILKDIFKSYDSHSRENLIVSGKILLGMDAICHSPWALHGKIVTVFDPMVHFELQMFDGRLPDLIDFRLPNTQR